MNTLLKTGLVLAGLAGGGLAAFRWLNQGLGALGTSQKHAVLLDLPTAHGRVRLERWEQSSWGNSYRGLVLLWQGRVVDVYGHVLATGAARALARADGSVLGPSAYPAYADPADYPALVYRRTAAHRGPAGWFENLTIEPDGPAGLDARARPDEGSFGGNLGQLKAGTNRLLLDPAAWPFADKHPAPTLVKLADFEDAHGQRLGQRFTLVKADAR